VVYTTAVSSRIATPLSSTECWTTRVYTGGVIASLVIRTLFMAQGYTVTSATPCHSITSVPILTETHRSVLPCKIVHSWLTEGIGATGVRVAQVSLGKRTTRDKRVSCVCLGTRTDSFVTSGHTVSTCTTGRPPCLHIISAGVYTLARTTLALLVKRTVLQPVALCLTADQGVTL